MRARPSIAAHRTPLSTTSHSTRLLPTRGSLPATLGHRSLTCMDADTDDRYTAYTRVALRRRARHTQALSLDSDLDPQTQAVREFAPRRVRHGPLAWDARPSYLGATRHGVR